MAAPSPSPSPSPPPSANPDDEGKVKKMMDNAFHSWDETEVALFIIEHIETAKKGDELTEEGINVMNYVKEKKINGQKLKEMTREEWKKVVAEFSRLISFPIPKENAPRVQHPLLGTLLEIPFKLQDASQGIWCMAMKYFNRVPQYDQVYEEGEDWCHSRAGRPYFNPAGWRRYGFYPKKEGETPEQVVEIFENWHVAYHGSKFQNADSIVTNGLVPPGTKIDGNLVQNTKGCAGVKAGEAVPIYVSPSIEYSAHWVYTTPTRVGKEWFYAVFQVRVRPGSFKIQGNTLWDEGWGNRSILYDRKFGPDELEWLVPNADDVRVTGLMIKKENVEPKEAVRTRFRLHKEICSKRRGEGEGKWFFNDAPSTSSTLTKDGPFRAYADEENKRIEKAFQNWQTLFYLGKVDTDIGICQYYINFEKMEQIRCDDNRLRRLVKREIIK